MKLIRFSRVDGVAIRFGAVIRDRAVAFETLATHSGQVVPCLENSDAYLKALPQSAETAGDLCAWGERAFEQLPDEEKPLLSTVKLFPPVEVRALFDFGLTPRHLANSAAVLSKYEAADPHTSAMLRAMSDMLLAPKAPSVGGQPERLSYYKGNLNSVVGSGESVPWPLYTQYLDIEPELAIVYGNSSQPVAGYCIFNDVSARDVQAKEFVGGFCMSKDMARGNQLGPWLVTPDEIDSPFELEVTVEVNGEKRWQGHTGEISHRPEDMIRWLSWIGPLVPGTVMGMGTIPDCTGLDLDDFLQPGSDIAIRFDRLGTLTTHFEAPLRTPLPSRWRAREGWHSTP